MSEPAIPRIRLGISSCLLGEPVRFDGGHARDPFLTDSFARYVEWVPVCPEVEMGLGAPRESIRLVERAGQMHLVAPASNSDLTRAMSAWAAERLRQLEQDGLCGYVLKRSSPSCGMERVRVHHVNGQVTRDGTGIFARLLAKEFPFLPIEEEGRLNDPRLRENFVSRVFAYRRWRHLCAAGLRRSSLMAFHAQHKYLLMSRNRAGAKRLGAFLGTNAGEAVTTVAPQYFRSFMEVMATTPNRKGHTNVLQHLAGYFGDKLDASDRSELVATIERYRQKLLPLIVPMMLIRHYVRKFDVEYLRDQVYLDPHPHELMLLNEL
jgi:uncharacterized protein YbgA (DUF1722 family)/uncharacterized protein YbbK (DUF523 family)